MIGIKKNFMLQMTRKNFILLKDYWFGTRPNKMNVPESHFIKTDSDKDPDIIDIFKVIDIDKTFYKIKKNVDYVKNG